MAESALLTDETRVEVSPCDPSPTESLDLESTATDSGEPLETNLIPAGDSEKYVLKYDTPHVYL